MVQPEGEGGIVELTPVVKEGNTPNVDDATDYDESGMKQNRKTSLKHMVTMGGHDGVPLGFKIKDIMAELERRPGDDSKDQTLIKLLADADKDGDGVSRRQRPVQL